MVNPIVQILIENQMNDEFNSSIVNILANDQKQELVMQKGWPDGYDEAHVEWLSWDEMLDYQVEYTLTRNKHLGLLYVDCKVPYFELLDNNSHHVRMSIDEMFDCHL